MTKWIKHKKEERIAVAAKVIGAVRLGLLDIRDVIEELDAEEMQQVPEIHMLLHESLLHNNRPLNSSKFALEKTKPRSTKPSLSCNMKNFLVLKIYYIFKIIMKNLTAVKRLETGVHGSALDPYYTQCTRE